MRGANPPSAARVSVATSVILRNDPSSIPLVALTKSISGFRCGRSARYNLRQWFEGIALTTISAPRTASGRSLVV